jgi:hypothetical protein
MSTSEPRNPFYLLLLLASLVFVLNALAYGIIPVIEERRVELGDPLPASPVRDALRTQGWKWLLIELAIMAVFAFLSMGLDRIRSLQKARSARTIPPAPQNPPS